MQQLLNKQKKKNYGLVQNKEQKFEKDLEGFKNIKTFVSIKKFIKQLSESEQLRAKSPTKKFGKKQNEQINHLEKLKQKDNFKQNDKQQRFYTYNVDTDKILSDKQKQMHSKTLQFFNQQGDKHQKIKQTKNVIIKEILNKNITEFQLCDFNQQLKPYQNYGEYFINQLAVVSQQKILEQKKMENQDEQQEIEKERILNRKKQIYLRKFRQNHGIQTFSENDEQNPQDEMLSELDESEIQKLLLIHHKNLMPKKRYNILNKDILLQIQKKKTEQLQKKLEDFNIQSPKEDFQKVKESYNKFKEKSHHILQILAKSTKNIFNKNQNQSNFNTKLGGQSNLQLSMLQDKIKKENLNQFHKAFLNNNNIIDFDLQRKSFSIQNRHNSFLKSINSPKIKLQTIQTEPTQSSLQNIPKQKCKIFENKLDIDYKFNDSENVRNQRFRIQKKSLSINQQVQNSNTNFSKKEDDYENMKQFLQKTKDYRVNFDLAKKNHLKQIKQLQSQIEKEYDLFLPPKIEALKDFSTIKIPKIFKTCKLKLAV